jgi:hypothetical protein
MLSIVLLRWLIYKTITVTDINHRPGCYLKQDVLETGVCLRLQVEPTPVGPWKRRVLNKRQEHV